MGATPSAIGMREVREAPSVLYHGSPYCFDEALPSFTTPITDPECRRAVYASRERRVGLAFALGYRSIERSDFRRARLWCNQDEVFVAVRADLIDLDAESFLYHMPTTTFRTENGWEWLSTTKVVPLRRETVCAGAFLNLVSVVDDEFVYAVCEHAYDPFA